jgi:hypothetical protein
VLPHPVETPVDVSPAPTSGERSCPLGKVTPEYSYILFIGLAYGNTSLAKALEVPIDAAAGEVNAPMAIELGGCTNRGHQKRIHAQLWTVWYLLCRGRGHRRVWEEQGHQEGRRTCGTRHVHPAHGTTGRLT